MHLLLSLALLITVVGAAAEVPPPLVQTPQPVPSGHEYFQLRGGLENCRIKFEREKKGRVVYLGGSITEGGKWRDFTCDELKRRFPNTTLDFINAGISSLGSTPHAFRYTRDALANGQPDLLFVEAAVNDSTNGQTELEMLRGMEGVVRHALTENPQLDIIMLHFADPEKIADYEHNKVPDVIAQHEKVAVQYNVASIDLAKEVTERIRAREFEWARDFKGLHPSPFGHGVYSRSINRLFDAAWKNPISADAKVTAHPLPAALDEKSYARGRLVDIKEAKIESGWALVENWKPAEKIGTRKGFVNVPALVAEKPGAALKFKFNGTAAGVFVAAGPDAGTLQYRVDGGEFKTRDLYTHWSAGLHLPWAQVLVADLAPGEHEMELRVAANSNAKSKGTAVRIIHFLAN